MNEEKENMTIEIPKQLQKEDYRFVLLKPNSKSPMEKKWTVENNYAFGKSRLISHLSDGGNYGVLCGKGNLVCLDIDDFSVVEKIEKEIPETFTIKTGSGKRHYYFETDIPMNKVVLNKKENNEEKHYGELQGAGSQVVGPNSTHPNGNKYEILKDIEIVKIEVFKLLNILKPYTDELQKAEKDIQFENKSYGDTGIHSIPITSVFNMSGFKKGSNGEFFGTNPWHGSTTGTNTWINPNKNVGYCFRCNEGLSITKIIALNNNIITSCKDNISKEDFLKVLEIAHQKYGLEKKSKELKAEYKLDDKYSIQLSLVFRKFYLRILEGKKEKYAYEYKTNPLLMQKTTTTFSSLLVDFGIVDKKDARALVVKAFSELKQKFDPLFEEEQKKQKLKKLSKKIPTEIYYDFKDIKEINFIDVVKVIERDFPGLTTTLEVGLSVVETLRLEDLSNPVGVNYEGPPSSEKTTAISIIDGIPEITFMSDNFTPASFVSHSASATEEELELIDLLPKIKNRAFLVPELAPLFGKRKEDLIENLSILTRIFDGEGLETDSGSKGHRGYKGDYLFTWIGATTPLPSHVWNVMGKLGQRFFFLKIPPKNKTDESLLSVITDDDYRKKIKRCKAIVHDLLKKHFGRDKKPFAVKWDKQKDDKDVYKFIVQLAKFVSRLRAPIEIYSERLDEKEEFQYQMAIKEEPERAINLLYAFARGHALLHERNYVTKDDAWIVALLALSSCPYERYRLLDLFENKKYTFDVETAAKVIDCSERHARRIMKIMEVLKLGKVKIANIAINNLRKNTFFLFNEYRELMDKVEETFKNKGLTWGGLQRQNDVQIGIQETFGRNFVAEDSNTQQNSSAGHENDAENSPTNENTKENENVN
jgi:hypothetical protein